MKSIFGEHPLCLKQVLSSVHLSSFSGAFLKHQFFWIEFVSVCCFFISFQTALKQLQIMTKSMIFPTAKYRNNGVVSALAQRACGPCRPPVSPWVSVSWSPSGSPPAAQKLGMHCIGPPLYLPKIFCEIFFNKMFNSLAVKSSWFFFFFFFD